MTNVTVVRTVRAFESQSLAKRIEWLTVNRCTIRFVFNREV